MAKNPYTSMLYKVDWLTFGLVPKTAIDSSFSNDYMLDYLGYNVSDFEQISGRFFYNSGLTLGNYVNIYYNDPAKEISKYSVNNVLYVFTGQGSTDLAKRLSKKYDSENWQFVWLKFFKLLRKLDAKITRIDIALDDYHGVLDFDLMEEKLNTGEYRSSKRRYNVLKQLDTSGNIKGRSIYVGQPRAKVSKSGNYFVRFYDKYAEYKDKSAVMPKEVEDVTSGGGTHFWQRYEIQFNKGKAQNLVNEVLSVGSFAEVYMAVMRNIIEFLEPANGKNKARWNVSDWWEKFLNGAGKCTLSDPERDLDLGRLLNWVRVAVVPSLHLLETICKSKGYDIYNLIQQCQIDDYAKKQKRLLENSLSMPDNLISLYLKDFLDGYSKHE